MSLVYLQVVINTIALDLAHKLVMRKNMTVRGY